MTTIAGMYSPRLVCLRPVLRRWIRLNKQIVQDWRRWRDVPWWYNERPSLSVLAGAVWQSNGIAFEEFSEQKRLISKTLRNGFRGYAGRVDIYFKIDTHHFIGETKFCWIGASNPQTDHTKYLKGHLERAKRDIRKSRPYGQRRLAILFASLYISKKQRKSIETRIKHFVHQIMDLEADTVAWVFPDIEKSILDRRWLCPGTAVIIKEVKR